ncbi:MAG: putative HTH-type transcriptional regulator YbaQ [Mycoplasmataceae bacterium]|nr:MAG: putative HTH-type transcriptional regulator YbaQ [Mycoplasmataceae bacterium]
MKQTNIHPGKVLAREFLTKNNLNIQQLAQSIKVSEQHLAEICAGTMDLDVEVAYRLSFYFQNDIEFWLDLQRDYDLNYYSESLINIRKEIRPLC